MTDNDFDLAAPVEVPPPTAPWYRRSDILWSLAGFALFCIVILLRATVMLEPDDFAYRASIVALSHGQILLTNAQYVALQHDLGGQGVMQWHHMASGLWISEKNPGYPFVAFLFYALGLLRVTPLFFGAVACIGLFIGATKWLGRPAGAFAVWLYLASGAALTFAWRATMPSFTDASLIAGGAGLLLWVLLANDARPGRRRAVGALALVLLELAVFIRYTNVMEFVVALLAVAIFARRTRLSWATLGFWAGLVAVLGLGMLGFNAWAYGSATATGYSAGEITFSISALWPNLRGMPSQLTTSMPLWILAAISLVGIIVAARRRHRVVLDDTRTDLAVGGILALGWLGLWGLYLNYTWTATMVSGGPGRGGAPNGQGPNDGSSAHSVLGHAAGALDAQGGGSMTVHVIRFYLPALGLLALLAAWLVMRLPRRVGGAAVGALALAGVLSFSTMAAAGGVGGGGGPGGHDGPQPPSVTTTTTKSTTSTTTPVTHPTTPTGGLHPGGTPSSPPPNDGHGPDGGFNGPGDDNGDPGGPGNNNGEQQVH